MARQTFLTFAFSVGIAALTTASPLLAAETVDKGTLPSGNVQIIGRFSNAQPSGIAVLPDGRMVLGFPGARTNIPARGSGCIRRVS